MDVTCEPLHTAVSRARNSLHRHRNHSPMEGVLKGIAIVGCIGVLASGTAKAEDELRAKWKDNERINCVTTPLPGTLDREALKQLSVCSKAKDREGALKDWKEHNRKVWPFLVDNLRI